MLYPGCRDQKPPVPVSRQRAAHMPQLAVCALLCFPWLLQTRAAALPPPLGELHQKYSVCCDPDTRKMLVLVPGCVIAETNHILCGPYLKFPGRIQVTLRARHDCQSKSNPYTRILLKRENNESNPDPDRRLPEFPSQPHPIRPWI